MKGLVQGKIPLSNLLVHQKEQGCSAAPQTFSPFPKKLPSRLRGPGPLWLVSGRGGGSPKSLHCEGKLSVTSRGRGTLRARPIVGRDGDTQTSQVWRLPSESPRLGGH